MKILTITCWSHEIRYHLFSWDVRTVLASGTIDRVALGSSVFHLRTPGRKSLSWEMEHKDLKGAIAMLVAMLTDPRHGVISDAGEITAVGHRVAHGGQGFRHSVRIDDDVLDSIRRIQHLAPLHSGPNIAGIEAARACLPGILHVAVFDTAFHASMPEVAYLYPLPYEWYEKHGVRRYGFHGPSHLYLSRRASVLLGKPVKDCNLITIHLDRGVSLCAIRNGRSIDTSMGMTPLEGSVMETRCGDIDPGLPAYIMQELEFSPQELEQILNHKSGIAGIAGRRLDRHDLIQAAMEGDGRCKLALEVQAYRLRKYIGSYLSIIGPLDAIVFTSGTGPSECLIREMVLSGLECFGIRFDKDGNNKVGTYAENEITGDGAKIRTFVIRTNEELVIAEDVAAIHLRPQEHPDYPYSFADVGFVPLEAGD